MALDLLGNVGNYLSIADAEHFRFYTEPFSIYLRPRIDNSVAKNLLTKGDAADQLLQVFLETAGTVTARTRSSGAGSDQSFTSTETLIRDGATWNRLGIARQASTLGARLCIYINGVFANSGALTARDFGKAAPLLTGFGSDCDWAFQHLMIIKGYQCSVADFAAIDADPAHARSLPGELVLWLPELGSATVNWAKRGSTVTVVGSPTIVNGPSDADITPTATPVANQTATALLPWSYQVPAGTFSVHEDYDWFASNGGWTCFYSGFMQPNARYIASLNKTVAVYMGQGLSPFVVERDHATGLWSNSVKAGTNPLVTTDNHVVPVIGRFSTGKYLVPYGHHNSNVKLARSTSADSIAAWDALSDIAGTYSYPHLAIVPNDDAYLFLREGSSSPREGVYVKSTDDGSTWAAAVDLLKWEADSRVYLTNIEEDGTDIHLWWYWANEADTRRNDCYYAVFDTTTDTLKDVLGNALTTPLTRTIADANANVKAIAASGAVTVEQMVGLRDVGGVPHFIVQYSSDSSVSYNIRHCYWNGSAWTALEALPSSTLNTRGTSFIATLVGTAIHVYGPKPAIVDSMHRWVRAAGVWGSPTVILATGTPDAGVGYGPVVEVKDAHADIRVLFGQQNSDTGLYGSKVFAYGDSGFVGDPLDQDNPSGISYTATLGDGSPLPAWLTFTAGTRTFSGTPPSAQTLSLEVTADGDGYAATSDTFSAVITELMSEDLLLEDNTELQAEDATTLATEGTVGASGQPVRTLYQYRMRMAA